MIHGVHPPPVGRSLRIRTYQGRGCRGDLNRQKLEVRDERPVSLLDQREWEAVEFGNQDKRTQGTYSKYLVCISCKARARFHPGSATRRATPGCSTLAVAEGDATVMARYGIVLQLIGCEYDRGLLTIKSQ